MFYKVVMSVNQEAFCTSSAPFVKQPEDFNPHQLKVFNSQRLELQFRRQICCKQPTPTQIRQDDNLPSSAPGLVSEVPADQDHCYTIKPPNNSVFDCLEEDSIFHQDMLENMVKAQQVTEGIVSHQPVSTNSPSRPSADPVVCQDEGRVEAELQELQSPKTPPIQSKGKSIKMSDSPYEDVTDEESDSDEDEVINGLLVKLEEKSVNTRERLKNDLLGTMLAANEQNIFSEIPTRLPLIIDIGKYVDSVNKKDTFRRGFRIAFVDGIPNFQCEWGKLQHPDSTIEFDQLHLSLDSLQTNVRWLVVAMIVIFNKSLNVEKSRLSENVARFVSKLKVHDIDPDRVISQMVRLPRFLKRDQRRGDVIEDYRSTSKNGHVMDRMLGASPSQNNASRDSDGESSAASSTTSSKRRRYMMETIAKNHPSVHWNLQANTEICYDSPDKMLDPEQREDVMMSHQINDQDSNDAHQTAVIYKPTSNHRDNVEHKTRLEKEQPIRKIFQNCHPFNSVFFVESTNIKSNVVFNTNEVLVSPEVLEDCKFNSKCMNNLKRNMYIIPAVRKTVLNLIDKGIEDSRVLVTFGDIINGLVKDITSNILGYPCFDTNALISFLASDIDDRRKEAATLSIGLVTMLRRKEKTMVAMPWTVIKEWCLEYSKVLENIVIELSLKRAAKGKNHLNDLKHEFSGLRNLVEEKFKERFQSKVLLFEKLSDISDLCVYILFGVTLSNQSTGRTLYTDFLVKTVLFSWHQLKKFPVDILRNSCEEPKDIYWCLPLAFLTNMKGIGITPVPEEKTDIACSIEEFWEDFSSATESRPTTFLQQEQPQQVQQLYQNVDLAQLAAAFLASQSRDATINISQTT